MKFYKVNNNSEVLKPHYYFINKFKSEDLL